MLLGTIHHFLLLIGSLLAGVIIGLMFELYKILIKDHRRHKVTIGVMDVMFWILAGVLIYFWLLLFCGAVINAYVIGLIFIGVVFYYFILAPFVGERLINMFLNVSTIFFRTIRYVFFPLRLLFWKKIRKKKIKKQ